MASSFGQEMLGRIVQDEKGKKLGQLTDLVIDVSNGEISELTIQCADNIDASRLPFPSQDGKVAIPSTEVASFGHVILLKI